ncbi:MAG: adenine phosphoribosyltransferase [Candidatus Planktophila sp.]
MSHESQLNRALSLIRTIPDYPKEGILFQDITPVLSDPVAFNTVIKAMAAIDPESTVVAGIEARGFIFASAIAVAKGCGFVPIRKKGKLPYSTFSKQYGLEYGVDEIEIHIDAFARGSKVLLVDDVLATGGTLIAAIDLVRQAGGLVTDIAVLSEITILGGRKKIAQHWPEISVHALVSG